MATAYSRPAPRPAPMNPPATWIQPGIPDAAWSPSIGVDDSAGVAVAEGAAVALAAVVGVTVIDAVGWADGDVRTPPPAGAVVDGVGVALGVVGLVDGVGLTVLGGLVVAPGGFVCCGGGSVGWVPGGAFASAGRVSTQPGKIRPGSWNVVRPDTWGQYLPLLSCQISGHRSGSPRYVSAMRHSDSPLTTVCSWGRPLMRTVTEPTGLSATAST